MNVEIMTLVGAQRALDATTVSGLRSRVRGSVLTAADAGYAKQSQVSFAAILFLNSSNYLESKDLGHCLQVKRFS